MRAAAVRQALLMDTGKDLQRRRQVVRQSVLGMMDLAIVSLYQSGAINRLPELPLASFDSNKVNAAPEAYAMGVPDATVSTALYAANMVLATAMGTASSGRKPVLDVLLGLSVAANAGGALYYLKKMVQQQQKICAYCITGAAINLLSAITIAPVVAKSVIRIFENHGKKSCE